MLVVNGIVPPDLRRERAADYLGLTMETVSRILTKIEADGLVRRRNAYTIQINR